MNFSNAARPFFATRFLTCTGFTGMLQVAAVCAGVFGFVVGASAQTTNGVVAAWGRNYEGQCNIPDSANSGVSAIAGGGEFTIALSRFKDCNNNGIHDPFDVAAGAID